MFRWHPLHRAPCVRAALRLQHRVHSNLERGVHQRHDVSLAAGLASIDLYQYAGFTFTNNLVISELRNGRRLHCCLLPHQGRTSRLGDASWTGSWLAVPYSHYIVGQPYREASVVVVNTATGACSAVEMSAAQEHEEYAPHISRWSSSGCLLVRRRRRDMQQCRVDVVDTRGRVIKSAAFPVHARLERDTWAPDSTTAVLLQTLTLWVWKPLTDSPPIHYQLSEKLNGLSLAWSPDSSRLLLALPGSQVVVFAVHTGQQQVLLVPQAEQVHYTTWGSHDRMAILGVCESRGCKQVLFYQFTGGDALEMVRRHDFPQELKYQPAVGGPHKSPDLSLVCVSQDQILDILTMDGHLRLRLGVNFPPGRVQWAADGSRLLVSNVVGSHHVLLNFV